MQDVKTEIQRNAANQSEMQPNALFQSSVGVAPGINHQSCRELSQRIIILLFHPSKTYRHRCRVISLKPWHHLYYCHTHHCPCVHDISIKLGFARTLWHLFHFVFSWWPHPVLTVSFWLIAAQCCSSTIALPMLPMLPMPIMLPKLPMLFIKYSLAYVTHVAHAHNAHVTQVAHAVHQV